MSKTFNVPPPNETRDFQPAPAGWHIARIFAIVDLGHHWDQKWDKETHLCRIGMELPKALREDGKPFSIWKRYTVSTHEKSRLRIDLEALYGKRFDSAKLRDAGGFDLAKILGRPCYVNVVHAENNGQTYANIAAMGPLPADMECPPAINKPVLFSLSDFDQATFEELSDKTKEQIKQSGEWQIKEGKKPVKPGAPTIEDLVDDIPF